MDGEEAFTYFVHPDGLRRRLLGLTRGSDGYCARKWGVVIVSSLMAVRIASEGGSQVG